VSDDVEERRGKGPGGADERRGRNPSEDELGPDEVPDVEIHTGVRARELRFGKVPETRVWFEGEPAERHSLETERENLPDQVEPDVTYRDARVRWSARARIVHPADGEEGAPGD
jgi:hypothetical protein